MGYIGTPVQQALTKATSQYFNGTGSQTVFTLNRAVNVPEDLEVFVNNIQQEPGVGKSYTATGTTLTFDAAPSSGTGNIYVIYRGSAEVTRRLEHDPNAALAATTGTFSGDLTVDTNTLYVDSTNNRVGVGTSSPTGNANANAVVLEVHSSGANPPEILAGGQNAEISIAGGSAASYLWSTGAYPLVIGTNGSEKMRIDSSGQFGIGTSSPATNLHIQQTANAGNNYKQGSIKIGSTYGVEIGYNGLSSGRASFTSLNNAGTTNNRMSFGFGAITSGGEPTTNVMTLNQAGNVGIGNSNPFFKLQIQNDSSTAYNPATAAFNTILGIKNNTSGASNNAIMSFTTESNGEWYIGGVQNSGNNAADFVFASRDSGARSERMRITSSGVITYNNDPTSGGGVNVSLSASYNDTSNHLVGGVNSQSFALITINTSNGATNIPVYRNGGAGVAYAGTMLDPDNQTWVVLGTSITFNQPGSFPQTFVVSITTGGSQLYVQRTSGSNAYSVFVQLLG